MKQIPVLLVGVVALGACSTGEAPPFVTVSDSAGIPVHSLSHVPSWESEVYAWDLTLERAIPTGPNSPGEEPTLYQPQAYALLADGTLVVLDGGDLRIAVLAPGSSEVVGRFAPTGQGPGEILSPNSVMWPAGTSSFWVFDPGNARISRFDVSGALQEERPVHLGGAGRIVVQDPIAHVPWFLNFFISPKDDGFTLVDSLGKLDAALAEAIYIAPMAPRVDPQLGLPGGGSVDLVAPIVWFAPLGPAGAAAGRSDSGRLRLYSGDGSLRRIINLPIEQSPVSAEDRLELLDKFANSPQSGAATVSRHVGEVFPVYELMWGVGDSVFALQQHEASTPRGETRIPARQRVWRLFSTSGEYEGAVLFPPGTAHPFWIEDDLVIATHRDELGVVTIQEFRLAKPGG